MTQQQNASEALAAQESDLGAGESPWNDGQDGCGPGVSHSPGNSAAPAAGGLWTIPLLCLGLAIIAACVIVPATDDNRRLAYEREKLKADLDQITRQIDVNHEFLQRIGEDPTLAERLAQRQMKMVREGTSILALKSAHTRRPMSPFELVTLPPPPDMPPYRPVGGILSEYCQNPRSRLHLMGAGLLLVAMGLVLGYTPKRDT